MREASPFQCERSTGNNIFSLARLFDSLVRVSRRVRAPHSRGRQDCGDSGERGGAPLFDGGAAGSRPTKPMPRRAVVAAPIPRMRSVADDAWGLALANKMEALSLSLSRFQGLCHSLSKGLFKLSLTLLVRYRSSYSVFNFGRHIPAD